MYCVKCGVELADSEKKCPLCGTPVFHPDIPRNLSEPPFPPDKRIRPEDVNRSGILFVLTIAALLPALLCLLCDWRINGTLVWSGYAAGAIGLLYIVILLPMWFRHPNPVLFVHRSGTLSALHQLCYRRALVLVLCFPSHGCDWPSHQRGSCPDALSAQRVSLHLRRYADPWRRTGRAH